MAPWEITFRLSSSELIVSDDDDAVVVVIVANASCELDSDDKAS